MKLLVKMGWKLIDRVKVKKADVKNNQYVVTSQSNFRMSRNWQE